MSIETAYALGILSGGLWALINIYFHEIRRRLKQ